MRCKKYIIKTNTYVISVASAFGLAVSAYAQIAPDAGSILRDQQKPTLELPKRPPPPTKVDEPARPALKPGTARFTLNSFRVSGNTVLTTDELLTEVKEFTGREVNFADLDQAALRVSRYYRARGFIVARAYLPAQDIKDGVVEIAVVEGRYGEVQIQNRSRVRDGVVRGYTGGLAGSVVEERVLERRLLLLNDLSGVNQARATLDAGARVGESDMTIDLDAAPLASGSVEFDNHGNRFVGGNRVSAELKLNSPLGLGDQLNARLTKGLNGLEYGRAGYQLPVGSDGFKLGASYSRSQYSLGKTFAPLEARGESDTYTLHASYTFVRTRSFNLYGQAAYDWNDFQDRIDSTATVTDKDTRGLTFTLSGDAHDAFGGGGISAFSLSRKAGRLNIDTPAARAVDDVTARTNGHFGKWALSLLRLQSLTDRASLYFSFAGQKAGKNLDSSEKFILGGANGVRAYPQGEASGDSGYVASAEIRYSMTFDAVPGVLQPFVFVDTGAVTINENSFAAGVNRRRLSGGGIGLTWSKANDFQIKATLATRIGNEPVLSDTDRHTRGWIQAIKYF